MRISPVTLCALLVVAAAGCKGRGASEPAEATEVAAQGAFCAEHGVLEAVCTKCNPKLIPVFQAKGDWCAEHGFPMSFCPIHHPERGGKPAADVAADDAPPDGTKVRLETKDTARLAGIEVVKAEDRPGGARLTALATIAYDATKQAQVNARSPGVVRALKADIGVRVKAGAPLAVIESAAVGADRSRLQAAASRVKAGETAYQREKALFDKGLASAKDVQAAQQDWDAAKAEHGAARAALGMVGTSAGGAGGYTLTAPIAGTVTRRAASVGRLVDLEETLFEIVDTSSMWAEIDVPEAEITLLAPGQAVAVVLDGPGDRKFEGKIEYIAPEVDAHTRTAKVRVSLLNPDGVLRANMFAQAQIALGASRATVMVPREAVQRAGTTSLVFVRLAEDVFEARRVETGASDETMIEVTRGVKAGEEVATKGSFLLKTETLKGSIGAGCCAAD